MRTSVWRDGGRGGLRRSRSAGFQPARMTLADLALSRDAGKVPSEWPQETRRLPFLPSTTNLNLFQTGFAWFAVGCERVDGVDAVG